MADEKSSGSWGGSFVVLAFAAVSAVYVAWQQTPLTSSRPIDPEYPAHEVRSAQDIDARLWEDPFAAVTRDIEARRESGATDDGRHDKIAFDNDGEPRIVLGVTLPGASYPEVAETRRRLRYAVLAALHVAGYTPTDEKHIGYWRPNSNKPTTVELQTEHRVFQDGWPRATDASASGNPFEADPGIGIAIRATERAAPTGVGPAADQPPLPAIIPWEQFDDDENQHVLVLWLDEDVLTAGRKPIASLVKLRSQLIQSLNGNHHITFALLGPEDSTMLRAMVYEQPLSSKAEFSVYNFGATAEERSILRELRQDGEMQKPKNKSIQQVLLERFGVQYYRVVSTDETLAAALKCELMRRDPNLRLVDSEKCGTPEENKPRDHSCSYRTGIPFTARS